MNQPFVLNTREYHRHEASRCAARAAMSTDKARTAYYAVQSAYHAAEALMALPAQTAR